jgi:dGTP triphosphohydrolase
VAVDRPEGLVRGLRDALLSLLGGEQVEHPLLGLLDPVFAPMWKAAPDDAARLRVVVDQVASLTDPAAVAWHRQLGR